MRRLGDKSGLIISFGNKKSALFYRCFPYFEMKGPLSIKGNFNPKKQMADLSSRHLNVLKRFAPASVAKFSSSRCGPALHLRMWTRFTSANVDSL
jgi:hypothetical protein